MSRALIALAASAAVAAAWVGGFMAGRPDLWPVKLVTTVAAPDGPVIYYQDPDGKPFYSLTPKQTADGRAYRPVPASADVSFEEAETAPSPTPPGRKIKYYRNPMGLPDTSAVPKKDPMGMDYIAVYEGDDADDGSVRLSPGRMQRTGVKSESAARRVLRTLIRAPGTIQLDERRVVVIAVRAESFVDSVENVTTGSEVRKDQPLMRLYSPSVSSAAAQYAASLGFKNEPMVLDGARQRLLNLAVPQHLVTEIERTRKVPLNFTWTAPRDGLVLERNVSEGMRAMPGDVLFRIADHSVVWALIDVAERDLAAVAEGQGVTVRARGYPDRTFPGKIALVYPHLNPATRTVRVRVVLNNPDLLLLPDMYVDADIATGCPQPVLTVPDSAVIDTGSRQIVFVDKGEGRLEPRDVKLGARGGGYLEIRDGLADGEPVVVSANFLIDAESNLKAALKGFTEAETTK